MEDVTFDDFHLPTLARLARELGSPRYGDFAGFIWKFSKTLPKDLGYRLMTEAGYVPDMGFPLCRHGDLKLAKRG